MSLAVKEDTHAKYVQRSIKNCIDAMTPTPIKAQNKVIKHSLDYVNRNFHIDKSLSKIVQTTPKQLWHTLRAAKKGDVQFNNASKAPTRHDSICKGRALIDRNQDHRLHLKSAQVAKNR